MLKVGIAGLGGMGRVHAARYAQLPDVQVVAVADIDPERLEASSSITINLGDTSKQLGLDQVQRYPDAATLIREAQVDVVDICLPSDLHAETACQAMEAGHHVLCEKPMALNVEDADRMIAVAQETGRLLMVAQVLRFWPEYVALRATIEEGTYGALRSLNMWRMGGRPGWSPDNWFLDPSRSGGAILDLHIHDVDWVQATLGWPDDLWVSARQTAVAKTYDVIHALFSYRDGPQVHMHAGWASAQIPFVAGYEAWFDRAFVRFANGDLQVFADPERVAPQPLAYESGDGYLNEIAYFLDCVAHDRPPMRCMPESTRDSIALIEAELAFVAKFG